MSSTPFNEKACLDLLREEGCSEKVIKHMCMVNAVAMLIAKNCHADLDLVNAGSWLHDIGRSRTHGVKHVSEGVAIARARELPEPIVRIIARHVAAGFTDEEASSIGLPPEGYMPETLEEKIVCHADNLVGDDDILTLAEAAEELEVRGYGVTAERMRALHQELSAACGIDVDELIEGFDLRTKAAKKCVSCVSH